MLEAIRDHLKTAISDGEGMVATLQQRLDQHKSLLADVEAELAKVPTLDDVRGLIDRIASAAAKTL